MGNSMEAGENHNFADGYSDRAKKKHAIQAFAGAKYKKNIIIRKKRKVQKAQLLIAYHSKAIFQQRLFLPSLLICGIGKHIGQRGDASWNPRFV